MIVTRINHISEYEGQTVQLKGWVYNSRRSGKIGFLLLRDGFGLIQCIVAKNDIGEDKFDIFNSARISEIKNTSVINWSSYGTSSECNDFNCAYQKLSGTNIDALGYIILAGTK